VLLEFVLLEDGGIRTVRIRESSGYQLLDEAAVEAVQRCVPFPRQPAATEIIVPIRFTLSR
jgi:protein TonB